jgi:hypothetical protein
MKNTQTIKSNKIMGSNRQQVYLPFAATAAYATTTATSTTE